jgi:FkbM family methyltransferase
MAYNRLRLAAIRIQRTYRKRGAAVYKLIDGRQFVLHKDDRLSSLIFDGRTYEPLESRISSIALQRGDVAFDVGANVGYYTSLFSHLVGGDGRVFAFEPGKSTFARLEETRALLKLESTELRQAAISDHTGTVKFWNSTAGHDAQQSMAKVEALGNDTESFDVKAITIDDFVATLEQTVSARIAFVKCDIEGAEPRMLAGAQGLIAGENPPLWLIEHNGTALHENGFSGADLMKYFNAYTCFFIPVLWPPCAASVRKALAWSGEIEELPDECNLLFIPRYGCFEARRALLQAADVIETQL